MNNATGEHDPAMELAKGTLEVLRKHGWGQGRFRLGDGSYCIYGAMHAARVNLIEKGEWTSRSPWTEVARVMMDVISEQFPEAPESSIVGFNDRTANDFADVERVLEKTIVRLQESE